MRDALTFVLPLARTGTGRPGDDLERARLLLRSLAGFFDRRTLAETLVVVPPAERAGIEAGLGEYGDLCRLRFVDEDVLCRELADDPDTSHDFPRANKGWIRQQVLKLAAHEIVRTEFYCTLDSDVLWVRPFSAADLVRGGRSRVGVLSEATFASLFTPEIARESVRVRRVRDANSEIALRLCLDSASRSNWYAETPVVYSRELMGSLARHLAAAWQRPWRETLLAVRGWTEQSLYFLHAEATGALGAFHELGDSETLLRLRASLWHAPHETLAAASLASWDLDAAFDPAAPGYAVVVQSYLGIPVDELIARVDRRLPPASTSA